MLEFDSCDFDSSQLPTLPTTDYPISNFQRSTANYHMTMSHPSEEELEALSIGLLSEIDLVRVSEHLNDCPVCRSRVDILSSHDALVTRLQAADRSGGLIQEDVEQRRQAAQALRQELIREKTHFIAGASSTPVFAGYRVIRRIGEGGMGTV